MTETHSDWLIVIDMQPGFGNPGSPWCTPGFDSCKSTIQQLLPSFRDRVLFTRFVPPSQPTGAWVAYYQDWPFALDPEKAWYWGLDDAFAQYPSISSPRFAKWHEAKAHVPEDAGLVLCGVATDCCVLGTAIEAADDGRFVQLVTDACAAGSDALHDAALSVMRDRAPMLTLTESETLLRAPEIGPPAE